MKPVSFLFFAMLFLLHPARAAELPSILWIYVDDMSDWMGCYGDPLAETPHIDRLAAEGTRFERAFMPSPVCSTTRSALITGTMQTSHGLHHHRTMIRKPLPESMLTIPELLRKAGYLTFNEAKDDYNFAKDREEMYSPEFERPGIRSHLAGTDLSWLEQLRGKRFFGQIQLKGGKIGGETGARYPAESRVGESEVDVPPYYPDVPLIRNAIARHYEQIAETDEQVGAILDALKRYDLLETTVIFFFTDHGSPLPRSKQFLYEEGLKVPLIVRGPGMAAGEVRSDLVNGIDISATTLALGRIAIPDYIEGRHLFGENREEREFVISARDRCGIAVDRIRSVRSDRFRYIRNYLNDRALYQAQYRDKHASLIELRKLHAAGQLNSLQASYHMPQYRPPEELYDLGRDPHQIENLAGDTDHADVLDRHRAILESWEEESGDRGRLPASRAELKAVYDYAKGKVASPEFDFLKQEKNDR